MLTCTLSCNLTAAYAIHRANTTCMLLSQNDQFTGCYRCCSPGTLVAHWQAAGLSRPKGQPRFRSRDVIQVVRHTSSIMLHYTPVGRCCTVFKPSCCIHFKMPSCAAAVGTVTVPVIVCSAKYSEWRATCAHFYAGFHGCSIAEG